MAGEASPQRRWVTPARRALALIVLVSLATIAVVSGNSSSFRVCTTAESSSEKQCRGLEVQDPQVMATLLLVAMLLLPDLDNIKIGGVELRRRLDDVQQSAEKTAERVTELTVEVRQIAQAAATATSTTHLHFEPTLPPGGYLPLSIEELARKGERFRGE